MTATFGLEFQPVIAKADGCGFPCTPHPLFVSATSEPFWVPIERYIGLLILRVAPFARISGFK
jgi:hypothetical protein